MKHHLFIEKNAGATASALAICFLLLSGCAQVPQLPLASSLAATPSFARVGVENASAAWPTDKWWLAYKDAQLSSLVGEALTGSPSMAVAQARFENAMALLESAGAVLKPQGSVDASVAKAKQSYNNGIPASFVPHGWNGSGAVQLSLSYDFDLWGGNRAALNAATSSAQAAKADQAEARLVLSTKVAQAYADLAQLYAEQETVARAVQVRTQTLELFSQRQRNGLETHGSVAQISATRSAAEAELLSIDESISLQKNLLAYLVGAGPERAAAIVRPSMQVTPARGLPAGLQIDLLGRRPDVVAAKLRAQAAASRIGQARAAFYPNVNFSALLGVQSLGLDLLAKSDSVMGSVGPAISLPLFDSGRLSGQYKASRAAYEEAVANYNDTVVAAIRQVADAAARREALGRQLDKLDEAVEAANEAYRVAQERYTGGLATYLDVLSAQETLLANVRTLTQQRARIFSTDIGLIHALGGGYQSSEA